ncbi:hypothetical protein OPIT5_12250 [Opitutaceae bacterium TAV5]|nr:hypothetical protein OPIT5_12250 [Opitutaceae bacterium TAV5]
MNKSPISFATLASELAARFRSLLGEAGWLHEWEVRIPDTAAEAGFDLLATGPLPDGGRAALCVECKRELRPGMFRQMAEKTFSPGGRPKVVVPVLALPFVSPRIAELCAEHGWSWFDLAGNCRLEVPGLLLLHYTGQKAVHARPRPVANLGTAETGRVIRALLAADNARAAWTQREMQAHCQPGVSLGLVNKVVRHLRDEAFIEEAPDGGFRLRDPGQLLSAWRDAYRFDRHERRHYFTLLQGKKLREALEGLDALTGGRAAYASFSAAEFQAPHVRQPRTWLYIRAQDLPAFEQAVAAKPVDSGENLVVLIPADNGVFYLSDGGTAANPRLPCTNAVQTYVDLWHSGGRGQEAAEALLEQYLRPAWKAVALPA